MAKKHAKLLSIILCILMLTSFAACGKGTAPSASEASASKAAGSKAAADPLGKYDSTVTLSTVRFLDSNVKFDAGNPAKKSLTENAWASAYQDQLNIKFNYLWTPNLDEYDSKWNVAIASGDIPDCASVDSTIYKELLDAGMVEDMTQYYNDYASDTYKKANTDDGGLTMRYMTTDQKLYGLPQNGTQPDTANLIFIRKDWLEKVNMPEPKTLDDLISVAQAFVKAKLGGQNTYGIFASKDITTLEGFFNSYGSYYDMWLKDKSANQLVYSTIQPQTKTALLKLQELYKQGLLSQDFSVKGGDTAGEDVASGKVGIEYGQFAQPLIDIKQNMDADKNAKWEVLTPAAADGSTYVSQASAIPGAFIFVKKGCEHPEAVVKVMNLNFKLFEEDPNHYASGTDGFEFHKYRFACETYMPWKNLNAYKAVSAAIVSKDTSKMNAEQKGYYDKIMEGTTAADKAYELVFGVDSTFSHVSDLKDHDQIITSLYESLPTDTQTSVGDTLKTTLDAAMMKVIMGADISTFDNAVAEWKKGGGDKITSELNEWYSSKK